MALSFFLRLFFALSIVILGVKAKYSFWNPPRVHHEKTTPLNPFFFFPCLSKVCDKYYGCFAPFTLNNFVLAPPIAGCPEIQKIKSLRILAVSKKEPYKFQSAKVITEKSKVAMLIHGFIEAYDTIDNLVDIFGLLKNNDFVIVVDRGYYSEPYIFGHIFIPLVNALPSLIDDLIASRIACRFLYLLVNKMNINPATINVVGFSAGAQQVGQVNSYCRAKYKLDIGHLTAIELPAIPYRYNNYPLSNVTSARFFDLLDTTIEPYKFYLEIIPSAFFHVGAIEVVATCKYNVNPPNMLTDQPGCLGVYACSHFFVRFVYAAAASGHCLYRYGPCPGYYHKSSKAVGYTRINCEDHPKLSQTCIKVTSAPLRTC